MALPFFGLTPSYRKILHSSIFDLIYHGNGGFSFSDVYNMPIWARKFYTNKIVEFKEFERKSYEKQSKQNTKKVDTLKYPT